LIENVEFDSKRATSIFFFGSVPGRGDLEATVDDLVATFDGKHLVEGEGALAPSGHRRQRRRRHARLLGRRRRLWRVPKAEVDLEKGHQGREVGHPGGLKKEGDVGSRVARFKLTRSMKVSKVTTDLLET